MRAIWTGAITFGLVNVPVRVYSATEDHDIALHQVHDADGGRIRYQRKCEVCGKVVDYAHIDKAYDDGDRTVILTDDDLTSLPEEKSREIDVVEFVPSDQLDPIMFGRSYFLEPASKSVKSYALLRRTLEDTSRTAIVHFALRQKSRLAALRVRGDVLLLQTLLWDDEVREASFPALDEKVRISDKELKMSHSLVTTFENDFDPSKFSDDYQDQLRQLIEAKLAHGDDVDTAATFGETDNDDDDVGGEVLDLMEALRRSVEASRGKKPGAGPVRKTGSAKKSAAAAKKSAGAKKLAAAKKPAAAKKTAASKKPAVARKLAAAKKQSASKKPAVAKKQSASIKIGVKRAG